MKKWILFFLLLSFFYSCKKGNENKQVVFAQEDIPLVEAEDEIVENTIFRENEKGEVQEFRLDTLPLIETKLAKELALKMKKWLSVYCLNINEFRTSGKVRSFHWDEYEDSMYHQEFVAKDDDVYLPALRTYSPNRRMYVNLIESRGVSLKNDTLNYYGGDDCQEIYLISRDLKKKVMILWLGSGAIMEDCFWIDNHRLALVGFSYSIHPMAYIHIFDIQNFKSQEYLLHADESIVGHIDYFGDHNLSSKGLPITVE